MSKDALLQRERRWGFPTALATIAAVAAIVSAVLASPLSGDGAAEVLRSADEHTSAVTSLSILQGFGFLLLVAPLLYLFGAALARSEQMRRQMVGVVVAAPIFLTVFVILGGVVTRDAAGDFVAGRATADLTPAEARDDCRSELDDLGAADFRDEYGGGGGRGTFRACVRTQIDDDAAENATTDASLRPLVEGFGFAGRLGLAAALLYTCLHAMRVGLLTRFWGSLGMALGVFAGLFVLQFVLVWFVYLGLLLAGWVPGGRPPAWAAGEAVPWPVPGEERDDDEEQEDEEPVAAPAQEQGEPGIAHPSSRKRKRKRRR